MTVVTCNCLYVGLSEQFEVFCVNAKNNGVFKYNITSQINIIYIYIYIYIYLYMYKSYLYIYITCTCLVIFYFIILVYTVIMYYKIKRFVRQINRIPSFADPSLGRYTVSTGTVHVYTSVTSLKVRNHRIRGISSLQWQDNHQSLYSTVGIASPESQKNAKHLRVIIGHKTVHICKFD